MYSSNNATKDYLNLEKCIKINYSKEKHKTKIPLKSDRCCPQHALLLPHFWPHSSLLSQTLLFLQWYINHSSFHLQKNKPNIKCTKVSSTSLLFAFSTLADFHLLFQTRDSITPTICQYFWTLNKNTYFHKPRKSTKLHPSQTTNPIQALPKCYTVYPSYSILLAYLNWNSLHIHTVTF